MECPSCGRTDLKMRRNRFGDEIFPTHKMARLSDYNPAKGTPGELHEEIYGRNPSAVPIYQMECPMSGQPA